MDTERIVVSMISHGAPGDTYWDLVRKGAEDAAKKNNIELRYSSDPQAPNQANLVQSAIDSDVDGIAVTMPNASAIGPVAKKAADAGIPTVGLNAGMDSYQKYGMTAFFGQEEKVAGTKAGERLKRKAPSTPCASSTNKATSPRRIAARVCRTDRAARLSCSTSTVRTSLQHSPP